MYRFENIVPQNIVNLKPYSSARSEFKGREVMFLDANENSLGSVVDGNFNRYPDPLQSQLKEKLSVMKGVSSDQILFGNGSDEIIDLIFKSFTDRSRDEIVVMPPTFDMFKVVAEIFGIKVNNVPLNVDFDIDKSAALKAITPNTKIVFICSPNNPTGNCPNKDTVLEIVKSTDGLVLVDEAYVDFAADKTLLSYLDRYPNLMVMQTFSKAWGMANVRLGVLYAAPEIIRVLTKVKMPYNVNGITQQLALDALSQAPRKEEMVNELVSQREYLNKELSKISLVEKIFPSDANFLLVRFKDSDKVYKGLVENGIVVRNRASMLNCERCLRITVGTPVENKKVIEVLLNLEERI